MGPIIRCECCAPFLPSEKLSILRYESENFVNIPWFSIYMKRLDYPRVCCGANGKRRNKELMITHFTWFSFVHHMLIVWVCHSLHHSDELLSGIKWGAKNWLQHIMGWWSDVAQFLYTVLFCKDRPISQARTNGIWQVKQQPLYFDGLTKWYRQRARSWDVEIICMCGFDAYRWELYKLFDIRYSHNQTQECLDGWWLSGDFSEWLHHYTEVTHGILLQIEGANKDEEGIYIPAVADPG